MAMLAVGLRYRRQFGVLTVAAVAWYGGSLLAVPMHVRAWYVAAPTALIAAVVAWPLSKGILILLLSMICGSLMGAFFAWGLSLANFWLGFGSGAILGLGLSLLATRFSAALFFGAFGAAGVVASVGPVARASSGVFSLHGVKEFPYVYVVAGVVLFLASVFLQVSLDNPVEDIVL